MSFPTYAMTALEQSARRMAGLGSEAFAGRITDEQLRNALADCARELAGTVEDLYRECYPPDPVPAEGPGIGPDSPLSEVVTWTETHGMGASASVKGSWLWLEGHSAVPDRLTEIVKAAGWRYSPKRCAWFHTCGVESKAKPQRRKSLAKMHGVSTLETFKAGNHHAEPAWVRDKIARANRRAALKAGSPAPAYGG